MKKSYATIKDLKKIIKELPDNMPVVIPVVDIDDINHIYGFRHVYTAGILRDDCEEDSRVLCLNGSAKMLKNAVNFREHNVCKYFIDHPDEYLDIADQIAYSGRDVNVDDILLGH